MCQVDMSGFSHMKLFVFQLFFIATCAVACQAEQDKALTTKGDTEARATPVIEEKAPQTPQVKDSVVASLDLAEASGTEPWKAMKRVQVTVEKEPFYKEENRVFEGYDFGPVMQLIPGLENLDPATHRLRFVCTDGYQTTFPFSAIEGARGVLADKMLVDGQPVAFPTKQRGAKVESAGPWYLVWENLKYGSKRPWPYQLTRIEILSSAAYNAGVAPPSGAGGEAGFALFQKHCQACHTMNLKGGRMGPELNVPRNITEYRRGSDLKAFIKSPRAFRATTTMPPTGLNDIQIDAVIAYLAVMAKHKVCASEQACTALLTAP